MDHLQRALLSLRAKSQLDVFLSERFAEVAVRVVHTALPARPMLLGAGQSLTVKIEVLVYERRREHGRDAVDQMPAQVRLQVVEARLDQRRFDLTEEVRRYDVERFERRRADAGEILGPLEERA